MTSARVRTFVPEEMPVLSAQQWRGAVLAAVGAGGRVVTLYGRPDPKDVVVTAVLETDGHEIIVLRSVVEREHGYRRPSGVPLLRA
jgi:hypothetical protein